ncbi:hypothetical protein [Thermaurantiacus sp.]
MAVGIFPLSPTMRGLLFVAVIAIALVLSVLMRPGGSRAFPDLADPDAPQRIELARGREQLVLHRRQDTGQWEIASADDAPADARRVEALVRGLLRVRPGEAVAAPAGEPLALRVSDARGRTLAEAHLWPGRIRPLPEGTTRIADLPMPPLAPQHWSTLKAPGLGRIGRISRLGPEGLQPLGGPEAEALTRALRALPASFWVPARRINWAGALYYQIETDSGLVEAQLQDTPEGRFVRLTAETRPDIRLVRAFAFRLPDMS